MKPSEKVGDLDAPVANFVRRRASLLWDLDEIVTGVDGALHGATRVNIPGTLLSPETLEARRGECRIRWEFALREGSVFCVEKSIAVRAKQFSHLAGVLRADFNEHRRADSQ